VADPSILEDESNKDTIVWGPENDTFIVKEIMNFSTLVLPLHFKHNKFSSFVRQLNKYNFHRIKSTAGDSGQQVILIDPLKKDCRIQAS
jgi:osomolarity two-component system response regulator SKN7